jgi:hypothetical protein
MALIEVDRIAQHGDRNTTPDEASQKGVRGDETNASAVALIEVDRIAQHRNRIQRQTKRAGREFVGTRRMPLPWR